ncbi:hypothetical protein RHGRI_030664 [Rhododendron griersonianum]|uniref:Reverse transcriptase n=1 Tax=Rhododendron griersonianum TaxID=479676 RepID=A0AAV6I9J7_9ERIC|nr:hypothetical protein RHGRI_030664 [Rhododendron griersonianum]
MSIHGDKAPGPDGFNSVFFQMCWDVVGKDFTKLLPLFLIQVYFSRNHIFEIYVRTFVAILEVHHHWCTYA